MDQGARCTEYVSQAGTFHTLPCSRKAVEDRNTTTGLFTKCKQHSKAATEERTRKQQARYVIERNRRAKANDAACAQRDLVNAIDRLLGEVAISHGSLLTRLSSNWFHELQALVERARQ